MSEAKTLVKDVQSYPEAVPGAVVRVHEKITETNAKGEEKQRVQIFQGTILHRKHGKEIGSTITVRKVSDGIGVEKIYPLASPAIAKIEVVKKLRVRRAKIGFTRTYHKKIKEAK